MLHSTKSIHARCAQHFRHMYSREVFLSTNVHIRTQKDFPGIHVPKMLGTTGMDRFC